MSSPHDALRVSESLAVGQSFALDRAHARGLAVREIRPKEAFTVVDGSGRFFRATLKAIEKHGGEALVYESMPASTESPVEVTVLCAVLARQRMLGVVQKATELGAMRIVPVLSARSVPREGLEHEKAHAWPGQAVRAARQCRRASLPVVTSAMAFEDALDAPFFAQADLRIHLDDVTGGETFATTKPRTIAFVVGPEGGFTDEERARLVARGSVAQRLGPRVLRAETAVLVGLTIVQHRFGDI